MTPERYAIVRAMAGHWMGPAVAYAHSLSRGLPATLPAYRTGIYITELRDGRCAWVGQTRHGFAVRLAQHFSEWERATRWAWVWIVPMLDAVPARQLDRIEGRIGAWLKPVDSRRLPKPY